MNSTTQRLCTLAGPTMCVIWFVAFAVVAGFMPPPSPDLSATAIAGVLRHHTNWIRLGLLLTSVASALLAPFFAQISVHIKQIEGRNAPLAYTQLLLGACFVLEFVFPLMILQAAAYRDDRPVETVLALDDVGWLMFVGIVATGALQLLVIGIAILRDSRRSPIFPRWLGYLSLWTALALCTGNAIVFFKDGPLAWNGILAWWLPLAVFGLWMISMTLGMLRAIKREELAVAVVGPSEDDNLGQRVESLEAELGEIRRELSQT